MDIFPSQGLAIARAWELISKQDQAEIVFHTSSGAVRSRLTNQIVPSLISTLDAEDAEDEALCREAERLMLSRAELHALMARLPPSTIDYSQEDDELPC